MQDKILDGIQTVGSVTTATGLVSLPLWIDLIQSGFEMVAAFIGCLVGLSVLYINWQKIKKEKGSK